MEVLPLALELAILAAAVVLHEVGHGVVAYRCGDSTAAEQGRLTLNPLRHVDLVGTILLPGLLLATAWMTGSRPMLFGWAKPVPVNARRMRQPRRDMARRKSWTERSEGRCGTSQWIAPEKGADWPQPKFCFPLSPGPGCL